MIINLIEFTNKKNFSEELEIPHVFASVYFNHYKYQMIHLEYFYFLILI
jgi:hypothetical protein